MARSLTTKNLIICTASETIFDAFECSQHRKQSLMHSINFYRINELIWNTALSLISVKNAKIRYICISFCRKALNVMCKMYMSSDCSTDENRRKTRNENWCTKLPRIFPRGSEFKHSCSITTYILYWRY